MFLLDIALGAVAVGFWRTRTNYVKGFKVTNPNDPEQRALLERNDGPHELGGILRMWRGGMTMDEIVKKLGKPRQHVVAELQRSIDMETEASHEFRLIHGHPAEEKKK